MKHYLITMFNIKVTWGGRDYSTDKDYLENRFQLFEKYTLPSVQNQSICNFDWIVMFSSSTPKKFMQKISGYQKMMPNFIPIFVEDTHAHEFRSILSSFINKHTTDNWIVTTRCDNDDILNTHFMEEIQNNINADEEYILSFPNGYQYDEKTTLLRKYYFPTNHFTTFISCSKGRTIYDFRHMDIKDGCQVKFVNTIPLWIEVVHGNNVYNCMGSFHFRDYVREYDLKEAFSISLSASHSLVYTFSMNTYFIAHKLWVKRGRIIIALKRRLCG